MAALEKSGLDSSHIKIKKRRAINHAPLRGCIETKKAFRHGLFLFSLEKSSADRHGIARHSPGWRFVYCIHSR